MVDIEKPLLDFDLNKEMKLLEKEFESFRHNIINVESKLGSDLRDMEKIQGL
jgi:hypothetical protein